MKGASDWLKSSCQVSFKTLVAGPKNLISILLKIVSGFGNDCSRLCTKHNYSYCSHCKLFKAIKKKKEKEKPDTTPDQKSHTLIIGLFGSRVNQDLIKFLKLSRSLTELPRTWDERDLTLFLVTKHPAL